MIVFNDIIMPSWTQVMDITTQGWVSCPTSSETGGEGRMPEVCRGCASLKGLLLDETPG